MKVTLTHGNIVYNGLFCESEALPPEEYREVELVGVPTPVDPGIVLVRDGECEIRLPTFVLEGCPQIDFASLLTLDQKKERDRLGLLGAGFCVANVGPGLIPIEELVSQ